MIYHPLLALSKIKGLTEVFIVGFYEDALFADFIKQAKREFPALSITYVYRKGQRDITADQVFSGVGT